MFHIFLNQGRVRSFEIKFDIVRWRRACFLQENLATWVLYFIGENGALWISPTAAQPAKPANQTSQPDQPTKPGDHTRQPKHHLEMFLLAL